MLPAHSDQQRVILPEQGGVGRQMRLDEGADGLVARPRCDQAMARQDAPGVLVGHEDRTPRRIEKNGIGGFRPDSVHAQEVLPERAQGRAPHPLEAPLEAVDQPLGEGAQALGLLPEGPRRADGMGHVALGGGGEARGAQEAPHTQRAQGGGRAAPRGELDQNGAGGDLVAGASRPPALRTVAALQRGVEAQQAGLGGVARRSGNPAPPGEQRAP